MVADRAHLRKEDKMAEVRKIVVEPKAAAASMDGKLMVAAYCRYVLSFV